MCLNPLFNSKLCTNITGYPTSDIRAAIENDKNFQNSKYHFRISNRFGDDDDFSITSEYELCECITHKIKPVSGLNIHNERKTIVNIPDLYVQTMFYCDELRLDNKLIIPFVNFIPKIKINGLFSFLQE